jgi:hypothetical protein
MADSTALEPAPVSDRAVVHALHQLPAGRGLPSPVSDSSIISAITQNDPAVVEPAKGQCSEDSQLDSDGTLPPEDRHALATKAVLDLVNRIERSTSPRTEDLIRELTELRRVVTGLLPSPRAPMHPLAPKAYVNISQCGTAYFKN